MNGAHNYHKNIKMYVLRCTTIGLKQECGHKTSRRAHMNLRFKPTAKIGQFSYLHRRKWVCWCYLTPFMFITCSVAYRYVCLHPYREGYTNTFSDTPLHRNSPGAIIEELSIRPTVRKFLISWGQKTRVKYWFIVMIWGLVCNNMYWYERHFGSFYRDPTILETVSIASQWVNTDWLKSCFWWNTTKGNITSTNVTLLR